MASGVFGLILTWIPFWTAAVLASPAGILISNVSFLGFFLCNAIFSWLSKKIPFFQCNAVPSGFSPFCPFSKAPSVQNVSPCVGACSGGASRARSHRCGPVPACRVGAGPLCDYWCLRQLYVLRDESESEEVDREGRSGLSAMSLTATDRRSVLRCCSVFVLPLWPAPAASVQGALRLGLRHAHRKAKSEVMISCEGIFFALATTLL